MKTIKQPNLIETSPMSTSLTVQPAGDESLTDIVRNWHDLEHPDGWAVCMLQPCHAIQAAGSR